MRILIIEDNRDSAESLAMLLQLDGHAVLTLFEGSGAIAAAQSFDPNTIVLDIGLPGMDGYEIARRLKTAGCSARLIAMTGYGQDEDRARAKAAGFDDHLLKPVDPVRLGQLFA